MKMRFRIAESVGACPKLMWWTGSTETNDRKKMSRVNFEGACNFGWAKFANAYTNYTVASCRIYTSQV